MPIEQMLAASTDETENCYFVCGPKDVDVRRMPMKIVTLHDGKNDKVSQWPTSHAKASRNSQMQNYARAQPHQQAFQALRVS